MKNVILILAICMMVALMMSLSACGKQTQLVYTSVMPEGSPHEGEVVTTFERPLSYEPDVCEDHEALENDLDFVQDENGEWPVSKSPCGTVWCDLRDTSCVTIYDTHYGDHRIINCEHWYDKANNKSHVVGGTIVTEEEWNDYFEKHSPAE